MDERRIQEQKELLKKPSIIVVFKKDGHVIGGKVLTANEDGSITFRVDVGREYSPVKERELTMKPYPKAEYRDKNKFTKWKGIITTYINEDNPENVSLLQRWGQDKLSDMELDYLRMRHEQLKKLSKLHDQ